MGWTVESSDVLLADRWIHLTRERVVTERGAVLDPYYVLSYPDWAVTVAITADDRIVLVRQYRHGNASQSLELPGGCVDESDATPLDAALRELREETGFGGGRAEYIGSMAANPALQTNRLHVAVLLGAEKLAEPHLEHGEELSVDYLSVEEAVALVTRGGMEQGLHAAALMMALSRIGRLVLSGAKSVGNGEA